MYRSTTRKLAKNVMPQTIRQRLPPSALRLLQSRLAVGDALGPMSPTEDGYTAAAVIHNSTTQRLGGAAAIVGGERDIFSQSLTLAAVMTFVLTYYVIFDWIYRGYCLQWDGMYITDGDDDEDEEDETSDVTHDE